jgi:hypothetical protein
MTDSRDITDEEQALAEKLSAWAESEFEADRG